MKVVVDREARLASSGPGMSKADPLFLGFL
jgi:hypothetical protein